MKSFLKPALQGILTAALILSAASCKSNYEKESYTFEYITVPSLINDESGRIDFLSRHFWDNLPWDDTTAAIPAEIIQKPFEDYLKILASGSLNSASAGLRAHAERCAGSGWNIQEPFIELFEKTLYNPNSPYRNEELYITVAEGFLSGDKLMPGASERFAFQLQTLQKNRPGMIAGNFSIITSKGEEIALYSIKSSYTMIFFYEPDCNSCTSNKDYIISSDIFSKADKKLRILAVYTGTDYDNWRKHAANFPENWIIGYDKDNMVITEQLYDRRASPSVYILDKDKKVMLKDADAYTAEEFVSRNILRQPLQ